MVLQSLLVIGLLDPTLTDINQGKLVRINIIVSMCPRFCQCSRERSEKQTADGSNQ
jgi:hypothetical protein